MTDPIIPAPASSSSTKAPISSSGKAFLSERTLIFPRQMAGCKLVYGIGVNNCAASYRDENGKTKNLPQYSVWAGMLERCYDHKRQARYPTYIGCFVCPEWLTASNFYKWLAEQGSWWGKHLDKDVLMPGNKIYSPDTCLVVDSRVNSLLIDNNAVRGHYPIGVHFNKSKRKFQAQLRIGGKLQHLGYFDYHLVAWQVFCNAKTEYILKVRDAQSCPRIRLGLERWAHVYAAGFDSDGIDLYLTIHNPSWKPERPPVTLYGDDETEDSFRGVA